MAAVLPVGRGPRPTTTSQVLVIALVALGIGLPQVEDRTGLAAQTPGPPRPYDGGITLEVWTTEDRIIHGEHSTPERRLLEEARYTLSGIIYGWDFEYTPGDSRREVSEYFDLAPLGEVPWGNPGLDVRDLQARQGTLYGQIDYTFSRVESAHREQWRSFATARSTGVGTGDLLQGTSGKIAAIEAALHQAVREYLRGRYPNRPREAVGSVALARPPRIRTVAGRYEARVAVFLDVKDVRDYLVF